MLIAVLRSASRLGFAPADIKHIVACAVAATMRIGQWRLLRQSKAFRCGCSAPTGRHKRGD